MVRSHILGLGELGGKLVERVCNPKKIVNLAPFFIIKQKVGSFPLSTEGYKDSPKSLCPPKH
jgi:hypothetical protein